MSSKSEGQGLVLRCRVDSRGDAFRPYHIDRWESVNPGRKQNRQ